VIEILEILKGQVSASMDGVEVLQTMVEHQVQTLKRRVSLLCNYSRVEDLTHETVEMLEVSKVTKWVEGLVSSGTVATARCAVEAFLVNFRPNLVSHLDSFSFLH
jgi:hypothetical protein